MGRKKSYNAECLLSLSQRRSNSTSAQSLWQFSIKSSFSSIFAGQTADVHAAKKTAKLQPKDPPPSLAQESRMWSSPRTSRFPDTHMAPPRPRLPSFWQPARRSTAPSSTKAWPCTRTQAKGRRRATIPRSPWKWTAWKRRRCSRKSVTPPGIFGGQKGQTWTSDLKRDWCLVM